MALNIATYVSVLHSADFIPNMLHAILFGLQHTKVSNYGQIDKLFFFRKRPLPNSCLPNFTLV